MANLLDIYAPIACFLRRQKEFKLVVETTPRYNRIGVTQGGSTVMRKIIFSAVLAALGSVTAANAGVVTISLGSGANFDAFDNNAPGSTSGTTSTAFGTATWSTTPGIGSQPSEVSDTSVSGRDQEPAADNSNYVFAQQGGSVTVSFAADLNSVTIYWGSPDSFNSITLGNGDVITGAMVAAGLGFSADGSDANSTWVTIADTTAFNSFTAASSRPAFEFDMAGPTLAVGAVPEPSTCAMLLLGFAGLGFAGWRGSRSTAARAA